MSHHPAQSSSAALLLLGGYAYATKKSVPSLVGSTVLALGFLGARQLIVTSQDMDSLSNGYIAGAITGFGAAAIGASRIKAGGWKGPGSILLAVGLANFAFYSMKASKM